MAENKPINYGNGENSSVGVQLVKHVYKRKALIEAKKEFKFSQLSDNESMPKNMGKTIKRYKHFMILDDRNMNDQGIDATGASTKRSVTISIADKKSYTKKHCVGFGANDATALANAKKRAEDYFQMIGVFNTNYDTTKRDLEGKSWIVTEHPALPDYGNLYGSSRDIGVIKDRLPVLGEHGGRVNRVGWKRAEVEATINEFGFFMEYTKDSINFDTESDLYQTLTREALRTAAKLYEDLLQIDLINNAGITVYGGTATQTSELDETSELTYQMLMKLDKLLTEVDCPRDTEIIAGSNLTDTRTIPASRYIYVGSQLAYSLEKIVDLHGKPAFIPVHQYKDAGNLAEGEIGAIGRFRFIEVPNMMYWGGVGKDATSHETYYHTDNKFDVFPALVVGSKSFTTIGFQTGGNGTDKFNMIVKKPGLETADRNDPYGHTGFYSISWWYGVMINRPEHIALLKVTAPAIIN